MPKYAHDNVVPFEDSTASKKEQVAKMFDQIAGRYDFLNRFLSVGIDVYWRKVMLNKLKPLQPKCILDVATGTADVALMAESVLNPQQIIGIDISSGMLELGREKIKQKKLNHVITLQKGDSENIEFADNHFDAVTVAFGVRNFENLEKGLSEILRVLKPGGQLCILEFSKPNLPVIEQFYHWYLGFIAPEIAKMISKNKKAYAYLNNSVRAFPEGRDFTEIMGKIGFKDITCTRLSLGISSLYTGKKLS